MLWIITALVSSYLVGSIPVAYLFGRGLKGIDIRQHGSGNVGATNALRVLGKPVGITVLVLDVLKGFVPCVYIADAVLNRTGVFSPEIIRVACAISTICGHNWPVFLNFKGGKGIASSLGVLIGLALRVPGVGHVVLIAVGIWLVFFIVFRFVSLASICAGIAVPATMFFSTRSRVLFAASCILAVFVLFRHKANIVRLLNGSEPHLSFHKK